MKHDELADDLAKHLLASGDVCVWTDMQMGPVGSPRPDVYVLPKEYRAFHPISYEVKVSMQDFRADTTRAKWQSYLPFSAGVVFACPAGLLKPADLPTGCGLIERSSTGWRHKKRPTCLAGAVRRLRCGAGMVRQPQGPARALHRGGEGFVERRVALGVDHLVRQLMEHQAHEVALGPVHEGG